VQNPCFGLQRGHSTYRAVIEYKGDVHPMWNITTHTTMSFGVVALEGILRYLEQLYTL